MPLLVDLDLVFKNKVNSENVDNDVKNGAFVAQQKMAEK